MAELKNKAIAIFDEPEDCWDCPCKNTDDLDNYCQLSERVIHENLDLGRPDWCPLQIVDIKPRFTSMSMEFKEV